MNQFTTFELFRQTIHRLLFENADGTRVQPEEFDERVFRLEAALIEAADRMEAFTHDLRFAREEAPDQLPKVREWALSQIPYVLAELLIEVLASVNHQ